VVCHDGRVVPLGQGCVFGAESRGEVKLVRSSSVRSVKRDNAENQRARIAPGLGRHWIGRPGCRDWLAELIASGPMDRSERPKDRSSMAGRGSAMRQRSCHWGEVRFRRSSKARNFCLGQRGLGRGRSGAARFSSSPSRPVRFRLAHPVGGVWRCRGLRGGWIGLVWWLIKSSFRAQWSADPESMPD
jgi:hypothetical protein